MGGVTTTYTLSGASILRQTNPSYTVDFFYEGSSLLGFRTGNVNYWYVFDLQGDVIGIVNDAGTQVVAYTYDAWGRLLTISGSMVTIGAQNPFRYRGYYHDTETGLYYLNDRYYDPSVGRFVNADGYLSTGQSVSGNNLFAYCYNNPVNMSDLSGNWPTLSQVLVGVAIVAGVVALGALVVVSCGVLAPGLAAAGGAVIGGLSAGTIATAGMVALGATYVAAVSLTVAFVVGAVESNGTIQSNSAHNQSVYIMRDATTNEVAYVGRTNDPVRRQLEHDRDPSKAGLDPLEVKFTGLTVGQARVVEQVLISAYSLDYLRNARREIARGNVAGFNEEIEKINQLFNNASEDELLNLMGR